MTRGPRRSAMERAAKRAVHQRVEGSAKQPVVLDEAPPFPREAEVRARARSAVFQKRETGGRVELTQQPPGVAVGHVHACRRTAEGAQPLDGFEEICLAVTEQRARTEREPELGLDAEACRRPLTGPCPGGSAFC